MTLQPYTLPDQKTLERLGGYETEEIATIAKAGPSFNSMPLARRKQLGPEFLRTLWPDPYVFAEKTHVILDNRQGSDTYGELVRFIPNYAQRELIGAIKKQNDDGVPVRVIVLKARQLGYSTFLQSWMFERCDRIPNHMSMTVSMDDRSANELFQKQITIKRNLWCPQETVRDSANLIEFKNGSKFFSDTAGKINLGRSHTLHDLHFSEVAFWPNASEAFTSALQAVAKHPDTAVFMETTANGAEGAFFDQWGKAERGESSFVPFFAPWFWDPEYSYDFKTEEQRSSWARKYLRPEDKKYQQRYDLSINQMAWRHYKTQDDCQGNPLKFRQEYPASAHEAFLSSGSPFFSPDAVDALAHQVEKPIWVGTIGVVRGDDVEKGGDPELNAELIEQPFGPFKVWTKPQEKIDYIVGVDTAEGRVRDRAAFGKAGLMMRNLKPDYSAAKVIERDSGRHVASWHGDIPVTEWAYVVAAIAVYYNHALLIPEVNAAANEVVNTLAKRLRYQNLYRNRRQIVAEGDDLTPRWGWFTDQYNRVLLFSRGADALNGDPHCTKDHDLVRELRTVVVDENGVPRAKHPNKDDRVLAWCLALVARYEYLLGDLGPEARPDDPFANIPRSDRSFWRARQARHSRMERHGTDAGLLGGGEFGFPRDYFSP